MVGVLVLYFVIGLFVLLFSSNQVLGDDGAVGRAVAWPVLLVILVFKALVYIGVAGYRAVMRSIG